MTDPLSVSVEEAARMVGLTRTAMYELIRDHNGGAEIPSFMVGRRRLIKTSDLERWIAGRPASPVSREDT